MAAAQVDQAMCLARAFSGKLRIWKQCGHRKLPGQQFCSRHAGKVLKHGLWEQVPPPEAVVPMPHNAPAALAPAPAPLPAPRAPQAASMPPAPLLCLMNEPWWPDEPPLKKQKTQKAANKPAKDSPLTPGAKEPEPQRYSKLSQEALAKVTSLCTPSKRDQDVLCDYVAFCKANTDELLKLPGIGTKHATDAGQFFLSDVGIAAWLQQLLASLAIGTVYNKFAALKKGFRGLNLNANIVPHWLEPSASAPPGVTKILREAKKTSFKAEPVEDTKGALTQMQVMEYVVAMIIQDKAGNGTQKLIANCFLLWVMAGRAHRIGNIKETRTNGVGTASEAAGHAETPKERAYICLPVTKLLGVMSARQISNTSLTMKFFLGDCISAYLWEAWMGILPEAVKGQPDKYFFPLQKAEGFEFSKPISSEQIKAAIVDCAMWHGQPGDVQHDANSIRRGLAMEVVDLLKQTLGAINPQHGRGKASTTDVVVYCPKKHLVEPGLLHLDTASIKEYFDQHVDPCMGQADADRKAMLLCPICGYPDCHCPKCWSIAAMGGVGEKSGSKHECWLVTRARGKQARNHMKETEEEHNIRHEAWALYGVDEPPGFKEYRFTFGS